VVLFATLAQAKLFYAFGAQDSLDGLKNDQRNRPKTFKPN
jgi:hypothetical protein